MGDPRLPRSVRLRRRLAALATTPVNFDTSAEARAASTSGWRVDDLCQPLPDEGRGAPQPRGSWEIARRLMRGYAFADPSIARAYYDPRAPLLGRDMLLDLQAFGLLHVHVGVRVTSVLDEVRTVDGSDVRVWGWTYVTLQGHVEMGAMSWQVWKWLDRGTVEFRVHAASRPAPLRNPLVGLGFRLLRNRERRAFLESTKRRMRRFTELGLEPNITADRVRAAARILTARPLRDQAALDEVVWILVEGAAEAS